MDLKLNVQKRGLSTTTETINEEFTLHYGHIFKGEKGDKGEKGVDGKDGERGADGKSAYQQAVEAGYKGSEEDFKELLISYPNKADKNGYYPAMSVGKAQGVVGISQVQEALTLETKPNGNIVIGNLAGQTKEFMSATPSGDPMHYAYEAAGAVWNEGTGYWELNELTDITNEDMCKIYASRAISSSPRLLPNWFSGGSSRTNIVNNGWSGVASLDEAFVNNSAIETAVIGIDNGQYALPTSLYYAFAYCFNLRKIITIIDLRHYKNNVKSQSPFDGCRKLVDVRIQNLKSDISFADSPLLSKESLLYMINNCASGVSFTITLHPDVDDKCQNEWLEEIDSALGRAEVGKQSNITLARA